MTKALWPSVRLGEVIRHRKVFIEVDDLAEYRRCRVQNHAQGIVMRDRVAGIEIKTKRQQVCRAGELLVAEIDAKVGGYGIVPPELDGAIVSSHYFLFEIDEKRVDRDWLGYFIRTPMFHDQVGAQGSTNYAAIRPEHVLNYTIPFPPLSDQRRIVMWLDRLSDKSHLASRILGDASGQSAGLLGGYARAMLGEISEQYKPEALRSMNPHVTSGPRDWAKHYVRADGSQRFYRAQDIGADARVSSATKVFLNLPPGDQGRSAILKPGDLMIVITGATVGRVAVYGDGMEPGLVSQHVAICRLNDPRIFPLFVWWGLRSPYGQSQLLGQRYGQGKPGLNLDNIRNVKLPLPPVSVQHAIVQKLETMEIRASLVEKLHSEGAEFLRSIMPTVLGREMDVEYK